MYEVGLTQMGGVAMTKRLIDIEDEWRIDDQELL